LILSLVRLIRSLATQTVYCGLMKGDHYLYLMHALQVYTDLQMSKSGFHKQQL